jgi:acyl-CoA synthetase (AMP-forming)/AMP-acid ligase II
VTGTFQLADLWETLADAGPDGECLVAGSVRHTRGSLDVAANRLAHALWERGVRPGQQVGIYARNRAEYVEALLASWKIAARPININWRYVPDELRYVLKDADVTALVVERAYLPLLDELAGDITFGPVLVLEDGSDATTERITIESYTDTVVQSDPGRGFEALGVDRNADDVYMLYTGGTTGMPKGVMWRHEDFFYGCVMGGNPIAPIAAPPEIANNAHPSFPLDALILGPLMHGGGQWLTLISIYSGNRAIVYTEPSFSAERVLDLIDRERPATIGLIGDAMGRPIAEMALANPGRWDLTSLVTVGNGGAMLTRSVKEQLHAAFPNAAMTDSFGASETGAAGREFDDGTPKAGPAFTSDGNTAVLDAETLEPLAPGSPETGMLARKGHIPIGYWNDPEKTARTFRVDRHGVRWVIPGDFAQADDQGRIVLLGRGSGCINSGGEKIFPEEVEAAIRAHPDVFDAVVVGVPDPRFGEKVVALVALRESATDLDLDTLQTHCRQHIAGYKVPRALLVGDAPRTNVGKPDYARAKEIANEKFADAS